MYAVVSAKLMRRGSCGTMAASAAAPAASSIVASAPLRLALRLRLLDDAVAVAKRQYVASLSCTSSSAIT